MTQKRVPGKTLLGIWMLALAVTFSCELLAVEFRGGLNPIIDGGFEDAGVDAGLVEYVRWDGGCEDAGTIDVLFIGNSYVEYSTPGIDIANQFKTLAQSKGRCVSVDKAATVGWTLAQHNNSPATLAKINSKAWDIVVVQEQSGNIDNQSNATLMASNSLKSKIKSNHACTRVLHYILPSWGDSPAWSQAQQTSWIDFTKSLQVAQSEGSSPAGNGFLAANTGGFNVATLFWSGDAYHPGTLGQYLIASVFYVRIFDDSAVGLVALPGVTPAQAATLQGFADNAVLAGGIGEWESAASADRRAPGWCSCPDSRAGVSPNIHFKSVKTQECATVVPYGDGAHSFQQWTWRSNSCGCWYERR